MSVEHLKEKKRKGKQQSVLLPPVGLEKEQISGMKATTAEDVSCMHCSRKWMKGKISYPRRLSFSLTCLAGSACSAPCSSWQARWPLFPVGYLLLLLPKCIYIGLAWGSHKMQILIQKVWGRTKDVPFLTSPGWCSCCPVLSLRSNALVGKERKSCVCNKPHVMLMLPVLWESGL